MLGKTEVVIVLTGIGTEKAGIAAEYTFTHYRIHYAISTGVCGGLNENMKFGDFILYAEMKSEEEGKISLFPDKHLLSIAEANLNSQEWRHVRDTGLTVKKVCALPKSKSSLAKKFNAGAVDMESYRLAEVANNYKIPFIAICPVFDTISDDLTVLENIIPHPKFSFILVHPRCIAELFDYYSRSKKVEKNISKLVCDFTEKTRLETA